MSHGSVTKIIEIINAIYFMRMRPSASMKGFGSNSFLDISLRCSSFVALCACFTRAMQWSQRGSRTRPHSYAGG
eukprot:7224484-Heterocapsa_arctica.AAC.1